MVQPQSQYDPAAASKIAKLRKATDPYAEALRRQEITDKEYQILLYDHVFNSKPLNNEKSQKKFQAYMDKERAHYDQTLRSNLGNDHVSTNYYKNMSFTRAINPTNRSGIHQTNY